MQHLCPYISNHFCLLGIYKIWTHTKYSFERKTHSWSTCMFGNRQTFFRLIIFVNSIWNAAQSSSESNWNCFEYHSRLILHKSIGCYASWAIGFLVTVCVRLNHENSFVHLVDLSFFDELPIYLYNAWQNLLCSISNTLNEFIIKRINSCWAVIFFSRVVRASDWIWQVDRCLIDPIASAPFNASTHKQPST